VGVACPRGTLVVSGGYVLGGDTEHAQIVRSSPVRGGWIVQARAGKHQTGWSLQATGLCARS
jgi:hypothetical protein